MSMPRGMLTAVIAGALMLSIDAPAMAASAAAQAPENGGPGAATLANDRLILPGPEAQALAERAGVWDATFTSWERPGAPPVVTRGLVAEREMIGPMLQERLHPEAGSLGAAWVRIDELTFNRTEGRWDYMSMDSRVAAGIMVAWSLDHDPAARVFLSFLPFSTPGTGREVSGQMLRMEEVVIHEDADHETKDQYFISADGVATKWLAKRYSYTRRH